MHSNLSPNNFARNYNRLMTWIGVYLDLQGAMVVEKFEDGEGELLRRVRNITGPDMPVIISLDLHANITEAMVEHATAITIFRTYPHIDMAQTGARAVALMEAALTGNPIYGGMHKIPFLFPLTSQCTDFEPCESIYQVVSNAAGQAPTTWRPARSPDLRATAHRPGS
jgi:microcystin degradation protein MlrC